MKQRVDGEVAHVWSIRIKPATFRLRLVAERAEVRDQLGKLMKDPLERRSRVGQILQPSCEGLRSTA
jgi:hypothetical protein